MRPDASSAMFAGKGSRYATKGLALLVSPSSKNTDLRGGLYSHTPRTRLTLYSGATTSKLPTQNVASSTTLPQIATPPAVRKKRRAKRSEEERINFFRTDPHVAQFEAYRVLCGSCDKWIRLRSNSSYCSIPWEAHRKSCLSKKSSVHIFLFSLHFFFTYASEPTESSPDLRLSNEKGCFRTTHMSATSRKIAFYAMDVNLGLISS